MALAVQGHVLSYLHKDFDLAFQRFESALRINPNAAPAWLWSAAAHAWMGNGRRAIEESNRAMALSPYDPLMYAYSGVAGMAFLADGQFERAIECGLRSIGENRTYTGAYKLLVLGLVLAGRVSEAQAHLHQLLTLEPGLTIKRYRQRFPGSAGPLGEVYCQALTQAGVPLSE
jgi:tetratricopeptide (TPR) repeat protein